MLHFFFFTFTSFCYIPHPLLSVSYQNYRPPAAAVKMLSSVFWPILLLIHNFLWQKKNYANYSLPLWQKYFMTIMLIFRKSMKTPLTNSSPLLFHGPGCRWDQECSAGRDLEDQLVHMTWVYLIIYRQTSFYASLYCTSQILRFLQIEGLWQPCAKQVSWHHFSNSICSLHVSVSHFGNFHSISSFFIIIIFVWWSVILWCYYCNCFGAPWTAPM